MRKVNSLRFQLSHGLPNSLPNVTVPTLQPHRRRLRKTLSDIEIERSRSLSVEKIRSGTRLHEHQGHFSETGRGPYDI